VRRTRKGLTLAAMLLAASTVRADDPPTIEHTPALHRREQGDLPLRRDQRRPERLRGPPLLPQGRRRLLQLRGHGLRGTQYCGILPAPREGKVRTIEYYVQAVDDQFQAQRTSTFQLRILPAGQCEFPQVVKGNQPLAIKVFATHKKQGARLDDAFDKTGVTFVPLGSK
jgi:hypothetical protein